MSGPKSEYEWTGVFSMLVEGQPDPEFFAGMLLECPFPLDTFWWGRRTLLEVVKSAHPQTYAIYCRLKNTAS